MKKVLLISLLCIVGYYTAYADGTEPLDNDSNGKREVSTLNHLIWISTHSAGLDYDYEQTADIDASPTQYWDDSDDDADGNLYNDPHDATGEGGNEGWLPIGNGSTPFTGSYDGMGHAIMGLTVQRPASFQGFFAQTSYAVIENLGIENGSISGSGYTGGLVGVNANSTISNCHTSCMVNGTDEVGGLSGRNIESVIDFSSATGNVSGSSNVGGLVGRSRDNSSISHCYATGQVSGSLYRIGGLVGYNYFSSIDSCHAEGNTNGYQHIGGLVGQHQSSTIEKSYATGTLSGQSNIGSLVGSLWEGDMNITFATGDVNATGNNAGGLVGYVYGLSHIDNSYSTGDVARLSGTDTVFGAFIGYNHPNATVSHSYCTGSVFYSSTDNPTNKGFVGYDQGSVYTHNFWDMQVSNQTAAVGATGLPTAYMRNPGSFSGSGWDFAGETGNGTEDIWSQASGLQVSYPYFTGLTQDPLPGLVNLGFAGGDGTPENPYEINWPNELDYIRYNLDAYYILNSDINVSETMSWDDGDGGEAEGWMPIGNYHSRFTGSLNGNNHTISGLYSHRPGTDYIGLFGFIEGATLENIVLENLTLTGNWYVGGLTSFAASYSSISSCSVTGTITGVQDVGGLVGWNEYSTISESYTDTDVRCSRSNAGGLIGTNYHISEVRHCFSKGDVTRTHDTFVSFGAFAGSNSNAVIEYSYATGNVFFEGADDPTGNGFVASEVIGGTYQANFWDSEASNQSTALGAAAASTSQMNTGSLFTTAGWDFMGESTNGSVDIWGINPTDNDGYPFLKWQGYKLLPDISEWPTADNLECGEALSASSLNGGSVSVVGVFSFTHPETIPGIGTNDYELTFTPLDQENHSSVTGTVSVTVEDNLAPVITSTHAEQVLDADAACQASLPDYSADLVATDNCDVDLTITQSPVPGSAIGGNTNLVSLVVSDDAGNTAEATFNVSVVDGTAPTLTCAGNREVDAGSSGTYTIIGTAFDPISMQDNCGIASIVNDFTGSSSLDGSSFSLGTTTVVWTLTDDSGNTETCSSEITVNSSTGIGEWSAEDISVYPNPSRDEIQVVLGPAWSVGKKTHITITDMGGKICMTALCESHCEHIKLNISDLDEGMYIMQIKNAQITATRTLIKE